MKRLIATIVITLVSLSLTACGKNTEEKLNKNLPWHVNNSVDGLTHVFGVDVGKDTFKDMMFKLRFLAEPALFESTDGKLTLEAYFGKKKFGALEARLIAELEADQNLLKTMLAEKEGDRDSTPSNHWKYKLNVKNTRIANDLRVWRLIYLPVTDYEMKQMNFFGKPSEKIKVNETAEYWLYPEKGMVLLYDTGGKEIFYYSSVKDFDRLKESLPKETVIQIR